MRLISDDVDFDLVDSNERAQRWEDVRQGMKLGYITPENMTWDNLNAVRSFFERLPIIEMVDPRVGLARVIATTSLREGWDWCFATTRDGTFGVFSLDEPSRTFLEGAVLHLWVDDGSADPRDLGRLDFTDLSDYQDEAIEASLAMPSRAA